MNSSDEDLRFASAGLSQQHAVLAPGRIELGSRVGRLVQEGLALRQAVDDVLVDCSLQKRQRVKALYREPGLETADAGIYYIALPEVVYVMQGHDVAHQSGHKAGLVAFVVELLADLLRCGPAVWRKREGLGKILNGRRHCGLLQMSELGRVSMGMVDQQMLKEEDRVERQDELDGHQILVGPQGLGFGADRGVTSQPL